MMVHRTLQFNLQVPMNLSVSKRCHSDSETRSEIDQSAKLVGDKAPYSPQHIHCLKALD